MGKGNILVTGASTGIGRVCALRLAELGYRVFAGVRKPADGEALRAQGWGRVMAMGLGGVAGVGAVGGVALAGAGVLRAERAADFTFFVLFAAYSVGVFVSLWNETPSEERPQP